MSCPPIGLLHGSVEFTDLFLDLKGDALRLLHLDPLMRTIGAPITSLPRICGRGGI